MSARHVHLSREHFAALFGASHAPSFGHAVTQPGQFVTVETVNLIGPRGAIPHVSIVAPLRKETQIELSQTDAHLLGVKPPVRESGALAGTPGVRVRGPCGEVAVDHGVIVAARHVHMSPREARELGLLDGQFVRARIDGPRALELDDVRVRVAENYALDLHLDTDEANAAGVVNGAIAFLELD